MGLILVVGALQLAGCETVGYYNQAVQGQLQLLRHRVSVDEMLARDDLAPQLRDRLALSVQVLDFAAEEIGLTAGGRYRQYVDLNREFVVWNVFAAPPFSLEPQQWCYPVVGCAPYRGYFSEADAKKKSLRLQEEGLETYIGGVPAYSTLGWFDDPLLSSFIQWPEADFVQLLIHELAHSKVWVKGDVAFNESFADFVGHTGGKTWFDVQERGRDWQKYLASRTEWRTFRGFLLDAKDHLAAVYQRSDAALIHDAKNRAMQDIQSCYSQHAAVFGNGRFDGVMQNLNNAFLVSLGTYADWVPAFTALFHQSTDWPDFFTRVEELGDLAPEEREAALRMLSEHQVGDDADGHDTKQVQCKAFSHHALDLDTAG